MTKAIKIHQIRTIVAHANDIDMSPFVFFSSLAGLLDYARLIGAESTIVKKLEIDRHKAECYCQKLFLFRVTRKR